MKQCQLLTFFILALILNSTNMFQVETESIADLLKQVSDQEEVTTGSNEEKVQTEAESSSGSESATEAETEALTDKPYLGLGGGKTILQGWMKIRSKAFGNNKKFPELSTVDGKHNIKYTKTFQRKNPMYKKGGEIPTEFDFWFRLNPVHIYYSFAKKDINIAGNLYLSQIADLRWIPGPEFCLVITEFDATETTICSKDKAAMTKWFCEVLKRSTLPQDDKCDPQNYLALTPGKVVIKTVTQPMIIIPLPSKHCNVGWDYKEKGTDWECLCKDGKEQSPVDLPPPAKAIETDVKPLFQYEMVDNLMTEDFPIVGVKRGEKNVIKYEQHALRIRHPSFGKIVTLDGAVYVAQEIVFHTPSEHQIDGNIYDMEMEIIHNGKTIGDTVKQAIFSILFKAQPGVFNKLIDKLDFFNLPNPTDKYRELLDKIFIPHVFLDSEEEDLMVVPPFSFFTYQGSTSAPPCNEQVIRYIASKPVELSNTALELFKEALRIPDMMDQKGNIKISTSINENNRRVQPLYGRAIFHYDHSKFNCPDFRKKGGMNTNITHGHYEKRTKHTTQYLFVNGDLPSGMPGAFVVPENEAKGQ